MPTSPDHAPARSAVHRRPTARYGLALLLIANVVVYVLQLVGGGVGDRLALPAALTEVLERPWTLFTAMFLHEHPLHLALMLAMLLAFGLALEKAAGSRALIAVYVGSGVAGAVAFVGAASLLDADDAAVGSSAAVLGVAAAFLVLRPSARLMGSASSHWLAAIVIASIALSVATPTSSAAHLTGVAAGLLAGRLLRAHVPSTAPSRHGVLGAARERMRR